MQLLRVCKIVLDSQGLVGGPSQEEGFLVAFGFADTSGESCSKSAVNQ